LLAALDSVTVDELCRRAEAIAVKSEAGNVDFTI